MKLSKHFSREEFACRCGCGQDTVDAELITILETVRNHFKKPITITSGNRCTAYNAKIGGAKASLHITSRAADFVVADTDPEDVYNALVQFVGDRFGAGLYNRWVHFDTRSGNFARWNKKT